MNACFFKPPKIDEIQYF